MTRVGILGGTFNPPHNGHVLLARTAKAQFGIGELRVHVSTSPPHKRVDVPIETRLALARLAFPDETVVRDDRPYSIDTVSGLGDDAIFLVGADQFAKFLTWREPEEILEHVMLGVATRPGYPHDRLEAVLGELSRPERVELFDMEPVPISSSDVRRLVAAGKRVEQLVPPAVAAEIERLGLYGSHLGVS